MSRHADPVRPGEKIVRMSVVAGILERQKQEA